MARGICRNSGGGIKLVNNLISNSATYTFTAAKDYKMLCLTVLSNSMGDSVGHSLTVTAGSVDQIIKPTAASINTGGSGAGANANTFLLKGVKSGTSISILSAYGDTFRTHNLIVTEIIE